MNDFTLKTSKGTMLKSMLNSPDTTKLIREALSSPLGSTSRAKAKRIFSIMGKLHTHNESFGMGGPGVSANPAAPLGASNSQVPDFTPKGMVMFNRIPKTRITYGNSPIAKKSQSQYLNEMVNFNKPNYTPDSFSAFSANSNIANQAKPSSETYPGSGVSGNGMGGPGYDGRGGFFSNVWDGIKNTASTALSGVGSAANYLGLNNVASMYNAGAEYVKPGNTTMSTDNLKSKILGGFSNIISGAPSQAKIPAGTNNLNTGTTLGRANTDWSPGSGTSQSTVGSRSPYSVAPTTWDPSSGGASNLQEAVKKNMQNTTTPAPKSVWDPSTNTWKYAEGTSPVAEKAPSSVWDPNTNTFKTESSLQSTGPGAISGASAGGFSVNIPQTARIAYENNNPGNLKFVGQPGASQGSPVAGTTGSYWAKFETPEAGQVALENQIKLDQSKGLTVEQFINKYAPSSENNTSEYLSQFKYNLGVESNTSLDKLDPKLVAKFMAKKESGTSVGGDSFNLMTSLQQAVTESTGPATFAAKATEGALGGTYADLMNKNQTTLQDKFKIPTQQAEVNRMKEESLNLPQDVTNYIKGRDTYIEQTDKEIDDYINKATSTMDLSNPENAFAAKSQLNYLYTLRGRQNQSYIGYLNSAIETHKNALDSKITSLNSNIDMYNAELTNANAITEKQYTDMMNKFADEYTALKNAPAEEAQLAMLQAQAGAAGDPVKNLTDAERMSHMELIAKNMLYAGAGGVKYVQNGFNLVQASEAAYANGLTPGEILDTYRTGIKNYLNAPEDKDENTGDGITSSTKVSKARDAIKQLNNLAAAYSEGDPATAESIYAYAGEIQSKLDSMTTSSLQSSGTMPKVIEAIQSIDQGRNWWTLGISKDAPLPESDFVKKITALGGNLNESMAKAIYAVFIKYYNYEVQSGRKDTAVTEALKQLLTMTQKDQNGNQIKVPVNETTIAQRIAELISAGQ